MNMRKRLLCRAILDAGSKQREKELIDKYAKPIYKIGQYEAKEQEKVQ